MSIKVHLVYNHLPRLSGEMKQAVSGVIRITGVRVEQHAKAGMSGPKHGRLYRRGKITHRASAPGEAPAVDTGKLKNSITMKMVNQLKAQVIASAEYAQILETRKNRPFFQPAVDWIRDWFTSEMERALGRIR